LGAAEFVAFLFHFAYVEHVAAGTENQELCGLKYRCVLVELSELRRAGGVKVSGKSGAGARAPKPGGQSCER
jgi:hypothetical protein